MLAFEYNPQKLKELSSQLILVARFLVVLMHGRTRSESRVVLHLYKNHINSSFDVSSAILLIEIKQPFPKCVTTCDGEWIPHDKCLNGDHSEQENGGSGGGGGGSR